MGSGAVYMMGRLSGTASEPSWVAAGATTMLQKTDRTWRTLADGNVED